MPLFAVRHGALGTRSHTIPPEMRLSDYKALLQLPSTTTIAGALSAKTLLDPPSKPSMGSEDMYESIIHDTTVFHQSRWSILKMDQVADIVACPTQMQYISTHTTFLDALAKGLQERKPL